MKFFPIFHQLKNHPCLIVGGGTIALRRAQALAKSGAVIDVISPDTLPALSSVVNDSGGDCVEDYFTEDVIAKKYRLIVAATDSTDVNERVYRYAKQHDTLVNVVSDQSLCDFIFPAIVDRNPLTIAISNSGSSPVLTRLLKQQVEQFIPDAYGELAEFVGRYRDKIKHAITQPKKRIQFWEQLLQGPIATAIFSGKSAVAEAAMDNLLLSETFLSTQSLTPQGEVYLIGAGPGDPELLTLRAFKLLRQSDVVLYDRLVSDDIMALVKPEAELVYVGKRRDDHSVPQVSINQLLVQYAQQGKRVARLKGGDPFVFGRGGEEIEQLVDDHIPFQVVPGITAANGCSAYSGIPLTHRDYAQSVQFVTGQLQNGSIDLNWTELIAPGKTLVFYMSLSTLPIICGSLIAHGMDSAMPVALIEKGTTSEQRVIVSTLDQLPNILKAESVSSPSLLIVGQVVQLSKKLDWFTPSSV